MPVNSRLQIYSIEFEDSDGGVCIVRCIGGIARVGQIFVAEEETLEQSVPQLTLNQIERYNRQVEFFDPPHNARVHLSGGPLAGLREGSVLVSLDLEPRS
ncbi:hypothetical protein [Streptomyces sp. ISL-36]|uniref:hypothetical protein n=1 Tax=Streptomyces sp. ISL-36 TaxID=2819182 RepID=UPI0020360218|nr:hypothetical protein [Streptomyces sp. ISL-36]